MAFVFNTGTLLVKIEDEEDKHEVTDLSPLCRVCAKSCHDPGGQRNQVAVPVHSGSHLSKRLQEYFNIQVENSPPELPKQICEDCLQTIESWRLLQESCAKAEEFFSIQLELRKFPKASNTVYITDAPSPDFSAKSEDIEMDYDDLPDPLSPQLEVQQPEEPHAVVVKILRGSEIRSQIVNQYQVQAINTSRVPKIQATKRQSLLISKSQNASVPPLASFKKTGETNTAQKTPKLLVVPNQPNTTRQQQHIVISKLHNAANIVNLPKKIDATKRQSVVISSPPVAPSRLVLPEKSVATKQRESVVISSPPVAPSLLVLPEKSVATKQRESVVISNPPVAPSLLVLPEKTVATKPQPVVSLKQQNTSSVLVLGTKTDATITKQRQSTTIPRPQNGPSLLNLPDITITTKTKRKLPTNFTPDDVSVPVEAPITVVSKKSACKKPAMEKKLRLRRFRDGFKPDDFMKFLKQIHKYKDYNSEIVNPGKQMFLCGMCKEKFPNFETFLEHFGPTHPRFYTLNCGVCNAEFEKLTFLLRHEYSHKTMATSQVSFTCAACQKCVSATKFLHIHLEQVHPELVDRKNFECGLCHENFNKILDFNLHVMVHASAKCSLCYKQFVNRDSLLEHMFKVHRDVLKNTTRNQVAPTFREANKLQCDHCSCQFNSTAVMQQHLYIAHLDILSGIAPSFTCGLCWKTYSTVYEFKAHFKILHRKVKKYPCSYCSFKFPHVESLCKHELKHQLRQGKMITKKTSASTITKTLRNRSISTVDQNVIIRHEPKVPQPDDTSEVTDPDFHPYICGNCNQLFQNFDDFVNHFPEFHPKQSMLFCGVCKSTFKSLEKLLKHEYNHKASVTKQISYICAHCQESFESPRYLHQHMNVFHFREEEVLKCDQCSQSFQTALELTAHVSSHFSVTCPLCYVQLQDRSSLIIHLRSTHKESLHKSVLTSTKTGSTLRYFCAHCEDGFSSKYQLRAHLKVYHELELTGKMSMFKCTICRELFDSEHFYEEHMNSYHSNLTSYPCGVCIKTFDSVPSLITHELHHRIMPKSIQTVPVQIPLVKITNENFDPELFLSQHSTERLLRKCCETVDPMTQTYICGQCNEIFTNLSQYLTHLPLHAESSPLYCSLCDGRFTDLPSLATHELHHKCVFTRKTGFVCCSCGVVFRSKKNLREHSMKCTSEVMSECQKCSARLPDTLEMNMHVLTAHLEVKCPLCYEQVANHRVLEAHLVQTHPSSLTPKALARATYKRNYSAKSRPHLCTECGHFFVTKEGLKSHIDAIHRNVRNFVCEICAKTFKRNSSLFTHRKTHEKPQFACDMCPKEFNHKYRLLTHIMLHINYKPIKCKDCGKRFVQGSRLNEHRKSNHDPNCWHKCLRCPKQYKDPQKWRQHMLNVCNVPRSEIPYKIDRQFLAPLKHKAPSAPTVFYYN